MDLSRYVSRLKDKIVRKDQRIIMFLVGILILVIAIPTNKDADKTDVYEEESKLSIQDSTGYAEYLEGQLENILSKIEGAGELDVMITLTSSAEKVIEKDVETQEDVVNESDSQGGSRTTNQISRTETTIYEGEEEGSPYVRKEISPKVEGAVVIAEGGDNAVVVKNITECIQALFGIESHKIRIVKKGG